MTELENDLRKNIAVIQHEYDEIKIDYKFSAENLSIEGYQKIKWHDVKKKLPKRLKHVLGYSVEDGIFAVVKWDNIDWSDDNEICYNVDYWTELPKINISTKE